MNNNDKRTRLSAKERREHILKHTFELICEKGFKSTSTRNIAKKAGINEALIYNYFKSKDELLSTVISEIINKQPVKKIKTSLNIEDFKNGLLLFTEFFLKYNIEKGELVKIILYACLENFPLPNEFNINEEGTFINWLYNSVEIGKSHWGFNKNISTLLFVSNFMGGLIYYLLQISIIKINTDKADIQKFKTDYVETFIKSLY